MGFKAKKFFEGNQAEGTFPAAGGGDPKLAAVVTPLAVAPAAPMHAPANGQDDLAKVRELLFGVDSRQQRAELVRLEGEISRRVFSAREDLTREVGRIENLLRTEINTAAERLGAEAGERRAGDELIAKKADVACAQLDARISDVDQRSRAAERELRDHLLMQCRLLNDTIRQHHEDTLKVLNDRLSQLKDSKMDRSALAELLLNLGTRLEGDAKPVSS